MNSDDVPSPPADLASEQGAAPAVTVKVVYTSLRKQQGKPADAKPSVIRIADIENIKEPKDFKKNMEPKAPKQPKALNIAKEIVEAKESKGSSTPASAEEAPKAAIKKPMSPKPKPTTHAQATIEPMLRTARPPPQERKPVQRPAPVKPMSEWQLVQLEVEQLRIRFPDLVQSATTEGIRLELTVPVIDPEFPFDLDAVRLRIDVPKAYPTAAAPTFFLLNLDIPPVLKSKFKSNMDASARTLVGQQALRPMMRFLDKNLEMMLTPPTVNAGFKFVPVPASSSVSGSPEPVQPRVIEAPSGTVEYRKTDDQPYEDLDMPAEYYEAMRQLNISTAESKVRSQSSFIDEGEGEGEVYSLPLRMRFKPADRLRIEPVSRAAMAGSIQIQLADVRMKGIGLLVLSQLGVLMRCDRCRTATPIDDLRPDVDRIYKCSKCATQSTLHFRMDAMHMDNFTAGYLRCRNGHPADLLPSTMQATCGQCAPEDPIGGSLKIERVQVGESVTFRCPSCHVEAFLKFGRVDWIQLPGLMDSASRPKRGAVPKLPTQVGDPLPDRGTCKHYRKSFRWFRFPCCGRAYPCDLCHDEDASNAGHTAEWAQRQICGACSREMSVTQKECACGAEPASTRHSAHWEGGKGMRDQSQMSKKDNKKYRNLTKPIKAKTSK